MTEQQGEGTSAATPRGDHDQGNTTPGERATSFQAVQGEAEHYNGAALLVSAYSALWVILLVWVGLTWRKQSTLDARLGELERVIADADRASKQSSKAEPGREERPGR
jgi:hypothetical protein